MARQVDRYTVSWSAVRQGDGSYVVEGNDIRVDAQVSNPDAVKLADKITVTIAKSANFNGGATLNQVKNAIEAAFPGDL